ncbi:Zinc metalloproteinase nas-1 [Diplonema papillatum]|nr:Zinc metalloproteinase nas-1 [Diplonema papillatum]
MVRGFGVPLLCVGVACFADEKMNTDGPLGAPYELEGSIQVPVDMHRHEDTLGSMPQDDKSRLWPGGKVRYVIGTTYTDSILPADHFLAEDDEDIKWAVEHVSSKTCIEFTKCQVDECEPPFVLFVSSSHCSSGWGRDGAVNLISVSSDCGRSGVLQQIVHRLGLTHEHRRNDRDEYISVNFEAVTRVVYTIEVWFYQLFHSSVRCAVKVQVVQPPTIAGFSVNSYDSAQFYPIPNPIPRYVASWVSNIDYSSRDTLEQFVGEDSFAEVKGTLQSSHNGYVKVYVAGDYTFYVTTNLKLEWQQPGEVEKVVVPQGRLSPLYCPTTNALGKCEAAKTVFPPPGLGMRTEVCILYTSAVHDFPDYDSRTPAQDWIGVIDFDTNGWSLLGYGDGHFTSRHTGYLTVTVTGDHTFYLTSNDGSRMFLDGLMIVDNGRPYSGPSIIRNATTYLVPGQYEVRVEYFQDRVQQVFRWEWQQPGDEEKVVVPWERLSPLYCPTTDAVGFCQGMRALFY